MKTTLLYLAAFICLGLGSYSQVQVGSGTSTSVGIPVNPFFGYSYSQTVYLQSEINAGGSITGVQYYFNGASLSNTDSLTIYMAHSTRTSFASDTAWEPLANLTQVFKGVIANPGASGWINITFNTPFAYNNVDNLIVAVEDDRPNFNGSSDDFYSQNVGSNRSIYYYSDGTNPNPLNPPSASGRSGNIPNTIFNGIVQSCPKPTLFVSTKNTSDSVYLDWTPGLNDNDWVIEYGVTGFVKGTGSIQTSIDDSIGIGGLAPATTYQFYLRGVCGIGDSSAWVGPISVTTKCITEVAPWSEDFENAGLIPNCWSQDSIVTKNWKFSNTGTGNHIGNNGVISGTTTSNGYFAWVDDSSPHTLGTSLLSPLIDISGLSTPTLSFYVNSNNENQSNVDFSVDVYDGASWNTAVYSRNTNTFNGWEEIFVDLSGLTVVGNIQLRFVVDENNGTDFYDDIAIDDIKIDEAPTCPKITAISGFGLSFDSINVTWVNGANDISWQIEYDTLGFTKGTGTIVNASNDTNSLTGLDPNTSYSVYVRSICGAGDTSVWVGPFTFKTFETCPQVTAFTSSIISFDSVLLSWNAGPYDSSYIIEYGISGFIPGTGAMVSITADSVFLTGLTGSTNYKAYIRGICGIGDSAILVGPISFTTPCAPYIPDYVQDFATFLPICWQEATGSLTANSVLSYGFSDWSSDGFGNVGSTGSARYNLYSFGGDNEDWLISPSIDLGNGTVNYIVEFDIALSTFTGSNPASLDADDEINFLISTDNGATWSNANSLLMWDNTTPISLTGDYQSVDLTSYTGVVKFAFHAFSSTNTNDNNFYVDNFAVIEKPSCPKPKSLAISATGSTTVDLTWKKGDIENSWQIEYGPIGFTPGTGTYVLASDTAFTVTNLTPDYGYSFYVRAVCGSGDSSLWIGPVSDTTTPLCVKAGAFSKLVSDSSKINVGWNTDPTHTGYILEYGPTGFTPGTGTVVSISFPNNFYSATGLNPLTSYDFYLKSICQSGDTSTVDGPYTYKTSCGSEGPIPYLEDFTSYPAECWSEATGVLTASSVLTGTSSTWQADGFANVGTTGSARVEIWSTGKKEWLISPSFNLGTGSNTYQIEFDIALTVWNTTAADTMQYDDTLALVVSTDNGATWSNANILNVWKDGSEPSATGDHVTFSLNGYNGLVKFGFYAASTVSGEDVNVYIDNFEIKDSASTIGVNEITKNTEASFKVYPNPNNGQFTILNNGKAVNATMSIMDIQGREVYNSKDSFNRNASKNIQLNNMNKGVYILTINKNNTREQHRIIVN